MDSCPSRVLDIMDKDGSVRRLNRLQGTKLDWYVKDMHRLKESTLKRHMPQLPDLFAFSLCMLQKC